VVNATSGAEGALNLAKELNKESEELLNEANDFFKKMSKYFLNFILHTKVINFYLYISFD